MCQINFIIFFDFFVLAFLDYYKVAVLSYKRQHTCAAVTVNNDSFALQTEKMIVHESLKVEMRRFFAGLSEREVSVLTLHYGLAGEPERSLEEIAFLMRVSSERVRQIRNRALKKLKAMNNNSRLESYMFELSAS